MRTFPFEDFFEYFFEDFFEDFFSTFLNSKPTSLVCVQGNLCLGAEKIKLMCTKVYKTANFYLTKIRKRPTFRLWDMAINKVKLPRTIFQVVDFILWFWLYDIFLCDILCVGRLLTPSQNGENGFAHFAKDLTTKRRGSGRWLVY